MPAIARTQTTLDGILERSRAALGPDFVSYRHHAFRVFNLCRALAPGDAEVEERIAIAAAFHDLAIWTDGTFDYLGGSGRLAEAYLLERRPQWTAEIAAMIENHHKVTPCADAGTPLAEPFRKADWSDISLGLLRFNLPAAFVREVRAAFPNAGFHRRLLSLTATWTRAHPFNPFPMVKP